MKKLLFGCLILLLGFSVWGDEVEEIIKNSPSSDKYPQAGALVLLDRIVMDIDKSGNVSKERYLLIKIFKDRGREEFGDIKWRYNKERQAMQVKTARTHLPNGTIVNAEKDAISDVSAPEVGTAAAYTNVVMKVISFPALGKDAVIEYNCKVVPKKKGKKKPFFGSIIFQEFEPILRKELTLIVPKETKFKYKFVNGNVEPSIKEEAGNLVYTWKMENIPQIIREPNMPEIYQIAPRLVFTSFNSWEDVGKWVGEKFYKSVKLTKAIVKKVQSITIGDTEEQKIRDISLLVRTNVRNVFLKLGDAGYVPNKAGVIYKHMYGDPRDKAVLLVSMLKAAGIEAYPALVRGPSIGYRSMVELTSVLNYKEIAEEAPSPGQFNTVLVVIPRGNGYRWINPMSQYCGYGYLSYGNQGREALIIKPNEYVRVKTPILPIAKNKAETFADIALDENGNLKGKYAANLTGYFDCNARITLKDKTEKQKDIYFHELTNSISQGTKLVAYSTSNLRDLLEQVKVSLTFEAPGYAVLQGNMMTVKIPSWLFPFAGIPHYTTLESRKFDLITNSGREASYKAVIKIPKGFKVDYLPSVNTLENNVVRAEINCKSDSASVTYITNFIIKDRIIDKNAYKDFKKISDAFFRPQNRMIILEKVK